MPVLDTVIGLAFVYFLLSLVISSLTEAISSVLNVRWSKLEQGMRELFAGASDTKAYDEAMKALDGHDFKTAFAIADEAGFLTPEDKQKLTDTPTTDALRKVLDDHGLGLWKQFADNPRIQALFRQTG